MKYNFDCVPDRNGTNSYKWDAVSKMFPDNPRVLPMWVADTDFPCPTEISAAVKKRAGHPLYGYSFIADDLAELVADWQKKRNNWELEPAWVTYSNGIVIALSAIITAFTKEGEGVIIQPPVYYPFRDMIEKNRRVACANDLVYDGTRWVIDFEGLERLAADPNNKLLFLCNPHNPVSRVYREEELRRIGEICLENSVVIVSDEIHSDIIYPGNRHLPIASLGREIGEITITATSPSKTFNIAGLQISAIIIQDSRLRERFAGEMESRGYIPNLFGTVALQAAYTSKGCVEYLEQLIDYLWQNYLFLDNFLRQYTPKIRCQRPEATFLMWLDCTQLGLEPKQLEEFFVMEAGVGLESGTLFGGDSEHFMRMNIGCTRAMLTKGLAQLKDAYLGRGF